MDKEKEVKRYEFTMNQKEKVIDLREKVDGRFVLFTDHEEVLKAERTRREEAEKKIIAYENLAKTHTEMLDANSEYFSKSSDKIRKLEALLQQERKLKSEYKAGMDKRWGEKLELEAKVKELDKVFAECYALNQKQASVIDKQNAELQAYSIREVVLDIASHGADSIIDKLKNQLSQTNAKIDQLTRINGLRGEEYLRGFNEGLSTANAKIVELESDLEKRKISIDEIMSRRVLVEELEEQLSTANAKIVELEKHDCEKFIDEGMGCSVCSNLHLDLNKAKEIQDHVNWRISSLETELSTANKKAEKLVEVLEKAICFAKVTFLGSLGMNTSIDSFGLVEKRHIEQALKEYRGGE